MTQALVRIKECPDEGGSARGTLKGVRVARLL